MQYTDAQILTVLRSVFSIPSFRSRQEEAVRAVLSGNDVVVVMPTGGGKSLCYQLPALLLDGITIVISPLISLMKDQVDKLRALGIAAAAINSSLDYRQLQQIVQDAEAGTLSLLYIAPERLESPAFLEVLQRLPVALLVVDEAHCISEWGHDFRKSYRKIPASYSYFLGGRPPIIALTATATPDVRQDIIRQLVLEDPMEIVTGFERPNIHYAVLETSQKDVRILDIIESVQASAIVYCSSRAKADVLAETLQRNGFQAEAYHAGLSIEQRTKVQSGFLAGDIECITATSAFGMGIDKPDIRVVIHHDMPATLEAYYQESGRAGRDGQVSLAILLYSKGDERVPEFLLSKNLPTRGDIRLVYETLISLAASLESPALPSLRITIDQLRLYCEVEGLPYKRVLEVLNDQEVIGVEQLRSSAEIVSITVLRDRIAQEKYLQRSKTPANIAVFKHCIANAPLKQTSFEEMAITLDLEKEDVIKALLSLEAKGLLELERQYSSNENVFLLSFPSSPLSWSEIEDRFDHLDERIEHSIDKLRAMSRYATAWECRSKMILEYFGQDRPIRPCGTCDVCRKRLQATDQGF